MFTLFFCHYLRNRSTLDIVVLGYIGILEHKEHHSEVWSVPPVTPCIWNTKCTIHVYTHLITINFSITFSTHVLTSEFKFNILQTGNTKTHTTVKLFFRRDKRQSLSSHKYRPSFITLQITSFFHTCMSFNLSICYRWRRYKISLRCRAHSLF